MVLETEPTREGWSIRSPLKLEETGRSKDIKTMTQKHQNHEKSKPNSSNIKFQNTEMGKMLGEDFKGLLIKTGQ